MALPVSQHGKAHSQPWSHLSQSLRDLKCRFPRAHQPGSACDMPLSQTQNEGKGHRDKWLGNNQEPPALLPACRACDTELPRGCTNTHPPAVHRLAGGQKVHVPCSLGFLLQDSDAANLPACLSGLKDQGIRAVWPRLVPGSGRWLHTIPEVCWAAQTAEPTAAHPACWWACPGGCASGREPPGTAGSHTPALRHPQTWLACGCPEKPSVKAKRNVQPLQSSSFRSQSLNSNMSSPSACLPPPNAVAVIDIDKNHTAPVTYPAPRNTLHHIPTSQIPLIPFIS